MGPLLFILYINDIVNTTLLELILFADDTTLLFSHQDIASQNDIINNELQEICNWFQANKLSVNASKTNYMVLGTHHSTRKFFEINQDINILTDSESSGSRDVEKVKLNVKLDGVALNRVSSTKFFGVIIDENLTWTNHIDAISKTVSRNIGMLTKLKHFVPENILYSLHRRFWPFWPQTGNCQLWPFWQMYIETLDSEPRQGPVWQLHPGASLTIASLDQNGTTHWHLPFWPQLAIVIGAQSGCHMVI